MTPKHVAAISLAVFVRIEGALVGVTKYIFDVTWRFVGPIRI